jgi:hypothetical protein
MDRALRDARVIMAFGTLFMVLALVWGVKYHFNHVLGHWVMGAIMFVFGGHVFIQGEREEDRILVEMNRMMCGHSPPPVTQEPECDRDQVGRISDQDLG